MERDIIINNLFSLKIIPATDPRNPITVIKASISFLMAHFSSMEICYLRISIYFAPCIVPKPLTLYTQQSRMGKRNKVVKLTDKKIRYIIRAKNNNMSTKRIALEMKVSESTVKRVWMYWMKNRELLPIK